MLFVLKIKDIFCKEVLKVVVFFIIYTV